jgi:hypothetical protein
MLVMGVLRNYKLQENCFVPTRNAVRRITGWIRRFLVPTRCVGMRFKARCAARVTVNLKAGPNPCLVSDAEIFPIPVIHIPSFYWAQRVGTSGWGWGSGVKGTRM